MEKKEKDTVVYVMIKSFFRFSIFFWLKKIETDLHEKI